MTNEQFDRLETVLAEAAEWVLTVPAPQEAQAGANVVHALAALLESRRRDRMEMRILEEEGRGLRQTLRNMGEGISDGD